MGSHGFPITPKQNKPKQADPKHDKNINNQPQSSTCLGKTCTFGHTVSTPNTSWPTRILLRVCAQIFTALFGTRKGCRTRISIQIHTRDRGVSPWLHRSKKKRPSQEKPELVLDATLWLELLGSATLKTDYPHKLHCVFLLHGGARNMFWSSPCRCLFGQGACLTCFLCVRDVQVFPEQSSMFFLKILFCRRSELAQVASTGFFQFYFCLLAQGQES